MQFTLKFAAGMMLMVALLVISAYQASLERQNARLRLQAAACQPFPAVQYRMSRRPVWSP